MKTKGIEELTESKWWNRRWLAAVQARTLKTDEIEQKQDERAEEMQAKSETEALSHPFIDWAHQHMDEYTPREL